MDLEPWVIVVLLGIAALLYAVMLPKRSKEEGTTVVKEVEATLEQYMSDIEKENDELVDLIAQLKQEWTAKQLGLQEQIAELRERLLKVEQQSYRTVEAKQLVNDTVEYRTISMEASDSLTTNITEAPKHQVDQKISTNANHVLDSELVDSLEESSHSIMERYSELFELYHQGKSIDTIGKTIGMHRGEVQLILQLAKQEGLKG